jgi:2-polyprenyl-3-methyl-5-hydroxy-6-metoxy-1,4-benzoquinol methylase
MLKPVRWTPDLVSNFWDALTQTKLLDIGFSKLAGRYLFEAVKWHLTPGARHLDFGAGDGDFVELLATGGYPAAAFESSERRRRALLERLAGKAGFLGAIGPDARETFDAVFMIEVIEHILDEQVGSTLELIRRFLNPSGRLVVTTPNSENLDHAMCVCPTDGSVFHRWQHVRSFSAESLTALLNEHGFEPVVVHRLELSDRIFGERGADLLRDPFWAHLFETERPLSVGTGENLVWIGGHADGVRRAGRGAASALSEPVLALDARIALEPRSPSLARPAALDEMNGGEEAEYVLAPSEMRHVEGHCWSAQVGTVFGMGDWAGEKLRSKLRLREEGLELGPNHSDLAAIAREGHSRFAHHGANLFFAASNNTSPDRNGRRYVVSGPSPAGSVASSAAPLLECRIDPTVILEQGGFGWAIKTSDLFAEGDTVGLPLRSSLQIFENGVPLGPPHSDHASIRELGGGRFSHWGEWLYFSSSGNLPPGRNACSYVLRGPAAPQSGGNLWLAIGGPHRLGWVRRLDQS